MKNQLIATIVGGLLLFIWQFLSYGPLNIHGSQMSHTANQEAILEVLSANLEDGEYFIPRKPFTAPSDEQQAYMQERVGKPWATVNYHSSMSGNSGMTLFRTLIIDLVAVFLLCWFFGKMAKLDMMTCLMGSVAVGVIGYLVNPYLDAVWFETNSIPDLIDAVIGWGLVGGWLGWWLPSRMNT